MSTHSKQSEQRQEIKEAVRARLSYDVPQYLDKMADYVEAYAQDRVNKVLSELKNDATYLVDTSKIPNAYIQAIPLSAIESYIKENRNEQ